MTHRLYPSLQQPVLTDAQRAETVTEDRWHQPWGEPRLTVARAAGFAIALMASGQSFDPNPIVPFAPSADIYGYAFAEPVRVKPGINAALQLAFTVDPTAITLPETVTIDRWQLPWAEPVRLPKRLPEPVQEFFQFQPTPIISMDWFAPMAEPVRVPQRLHEANQLAYTISPFALSAVENLFWFTPWAEPVRIRPAGMKHMYQSAQHQILASTYRRTFSFGYVLA